MARKLLLILCVLLLPKIGYATVTMNGVSIKGIHQQVTPLKIMPVGDSTTYLFEWREQFQANEIQVGYFDFVGQYQNPSSDPTYDVDHEGVDGDTTTGVLARIATALTVNQPDIVFLLIGINDVKNEVITHEQAIDNAEDIIDLIDAYNPNVPIYVGLVTPSLTTYINNNITTYNGLYNTRLQTLQATRNIIIVDQNSALVNDASCSTLSNCYDDYLHFNDTGGAVVAHQFGLCLSSTSNVNCNGN